MVVVALRRLGLARGVSGGRRGGGRRRGGGGSRGLRVHDGRSVRGGILPDGRRRARREGSRGGAVHEDVVLGALDEVVQVLVERRGVVTLEHVVPLLLKPEERRLWPVRAVRRPRLQALLRLGATSVCFRGLDLFFYHTSRRCEIETRGIWRKWGLPRTDEQPSAFRAALALSHP